MRLPKLFRTYAGLDRSVYFLFLAQVVNSVGHFVHPFLTLFLTSKLGMDPGEAGFFVLLSLTAWVPGSLIGGAVADRFNRKRTLILFQTLPALALVPCAFLGAVRLVAWLLIGVSFLHGLAEPVNDAMLTDLTPAARRRSAFSLLYLGHNIGVAVGPLAAGFLFNRNLAWFFLGDAVTSLAAVVLIAVFVRESKPTGEQVRRASRRARTPSARRRGRSLAVLRRRPFLVAFLFINIPLSLAYAQTHFSLPLQLTGLFGGERGADLRGARQRQRRGGDRADDGRAPPERPGARRPDRGPLGGVLRRRVRDDRAGAHGALAPGARRSSGPSARSWEPPAPAPTWPTTLP